MCLCSAGISGGGLQHAGDHPLFSASGRHDHNLRSLRAATDHDHRQSSEL